MAVVRVTDPETSRMAAEVAVKTRQRCQSAIVNALWLLDRLTDEQIEEVVNLYGPRFSLSGLRTRRVELERKGVVQAARNADGTLYRRKARSGCMAQVWELTPKGDEAA